MPAPPDVAALAAAGAALLHAGQALAVWEDGRLSVELTAVVDGRAASATARSGAEADLARAAKQAALRARQMRALPAPPLSAPDRASVASPPSWVADAPVASGTALIAVASTTGLRAFERRAWLRADVAEAAADGRRASASHWTDRTPAQAGDGAAQFGAEAGDAAAQSGVGAGDGAARHGTEADNGAEGRDAGAGDGAARCGAEAGDGAERRDAGAGDGATRHGAGLDAAAAAEVRALLGTGPAPGPLVAMVPPVVARLAGGPVRAVLGPEAVAVVLDGVRARFGVDAALGAAGLGERIAPAGVDLDDDGRHPETLRRAGDVEGVARVRVALVRDGVVVGAVLDAAAGARAGAPSTGHATRPLTLAPQPEHLVLGGGVAADVEALCEVVGDCVYLPTLARGTDGYEAPGAARIERGRLVGALPGLRVALDAATLLAAIAGMTAARRVVGLRGHAPGGPGAAVVPALASTAGVEVVHVGQA